jgi:hypothetical protein
MVNKFVIVSGIVLSGWLGVAVMAQEPSTIVMKSGERISGDLIDMNGSGFAIRVNGQDRNIPAGDVASVEFVGGSMPADAQNRVDAVSRSWCCGAARWSKGVCRTLAEHVLCG